MLNKDRMSVVNLVEILILIIRAITLHASDVTNDAALKHRTADSLKLMTQAANFI